MTTPYDPRKPLSEHSRADVELVFGKKGDAAKASRMFRENRPLYDSLRKAAEDYKILGPSLIKTPAPNTPYKPPVKTYTPSELKLRGDFSEDYCRQLFASGDAKAAKALFESDREAYENVKDSAIAFGILPARLTPRPQPAPVAAPEPLHRISPELAAESGLPRDVELPWAQVTQLIEQKLDRARKAQADADAKADADRQVELAALTARQQADEAVRLQKQADLDRLAALLVPAQTPTPEDPAIALQRAIAAEKQAA